MGDEEALYFRGTAHGFAGRASLQDLKITPATLDPVVATIFAVAAQAFGRGVVYIARASDLRGVTISEGNVLASLESEVAVGIAPLEFARRAGIVLDAAEAGSFLRTLGIAVPVQIREPAGVSLALRFLPRANREQIHRFMELAVSLGRQA